MATGASGDIAIREHQPVKKEPMRVQPQTAPHRPGRPTPNPVPGGLRPLPQTPDTAPEESRPPNRPPPKAPQRQAVQFDTPPLEGVENVPQRPKGPPPLRPSRPIPSDIQ